MASSNVTPPPPPQWVIDLNSAPPAKTKTQNIQDPPGFAAAVALAAPASKRGNASQIAAASKARKPPTTEEMDTLKVKKAWEVAIAPAKSLPMSAIGMWMSGNSLQIFSIFMVFQLFKTPITGLLNVQQQFSRFESDGTKQTLIMVKVVFVLCNLLGIALGVWKINKMGLLPYESKGHADNRTTRSDWLAWETRREPLERAYPAFPL